MRPTMLLTDGNLGPDAVVEQVKKVGIPVVILKPGSTVDSAQSLMAQLGERFITEGSRGQRDCRLEAGHGRRHRRHGTSGRAHREPRVLVMHFGQLDNNYLALKRGSAADQVIQWAGGVNAVDSVGGMMRLTPELIAARRPTSSSPPTSASTGSGAPTSSPRCRAWRSRRRRRPRRVYRVDETEVMYFGPRTAASVRKIAGWLHPATAPAARQ